MFGSAAFMCECGHTDVPNHPDDGPCSICECPKFKWGKEDETKKAVVKLYLARKK